MTFIHYLVQVNLYLLLFYGFYRILLSSETFYGLNRAYLVGSAVLSFGIPFWYSDYIQSFFITQQVNQVFYAVLSPAVFGVKASVENPVTWYDLLQVFYGICTVFLAIKLIFNLLQLKRILNNSANHAKFGAGFSFFNFVFVDKDLQKHEVVMQHEYVHIKQLHSADVILFEVIAVLCWFNPVVYFYKKSIKNIHEFIADDIASRLEATKADYAMLLFSQQFGLNPHQLTNQFIDKSTLKRRIEMLHKPRSRKIALLKYGFTAPLFALMLVIASASIAKNNGIKQVEKIVATTAKMPITVLSIRPMTEILPQEDGIVTGKITATEDGAPLVGAIITVVGKNRGTSTDKNGDYSIKASPEDELEFSFEGYESNTVPVTDKKVISVSLRTGSQANMKGRGEALSEVAVVGYKPTNSFEGEEIFSTAEVNPSFPGGIVELYRFISKNLKYPEEARNKYVDGLVFVKFIVRADGSTSDVKVLKGIGFGCDEEVVRVIGMMPKWESGKQMGKSVSVYFTMPVKFTLEEGTKVVRKYDPVKNNSVRIKLNGTELEVENKTAPINSGDMLWVIDGVVVDKDAIKDIEPSEIESISVLKDDPAKLLYGRQAKNGAILVTTKKNFLTELSSNSTGEDEIFATVAEVPTFVGGTNAMYSFIGKNLKYPKEAQRNNIKGTVFLNFIVRKDGSITDLTVLKGIGTGCDDEAKRIVALMPKWNPGKQKGVPVNTYYTLPLRFVLE